MPGLGGRAAEVATAIEQGTLGPLLGATPSARRAALEGAVHASFAGTLDLLLAVSAVLALAGGVCALGLIRSRDFVNPRPVPPGDGPGRPTGTGRTRTAPAGTVPAGTAL